MHAANDGDGDGRDGDEGADDDGCDGHFARQPCRTWRPKRFEPKSRRTMADMTNPKATCSRLVARQRSQTMTPIRSASRHHAVRRYFCQA
jgi:hypothetical protein